MSKKQVAVIGGGFSGLAVVYNLIELSKNSQQIEIDIFDDEDFQHNGNAYKTSDINHILNVPANKMGLPFGQEEHFYNWLKHVVQIQKDSFVSRGFYRFYLHEIILELQKNSNVNFIHKKILGIKIVNQKYVLISKDSLQKEYDHVVIASGLKTKNLPANFKSEKIVDNIWQFFNERKLPKSGTVLIAGSGLTMIDAVLSLVNNGFDGKIISCSRQAKLPLSHSASQIKAVKSLEIQDAKLPLSQILKKFRNLVKDDDWQSLLHGIRPITSQIWQEFSINKKRQFLRHLMGFWNIHRHRVAKENNHRIMQLIKSGKLEIIKGRIEDIKENNGQISAILNNKIINADLILNATGFDFSGSKSDLIKNLLKEKIIFSHETGLGFAVNKDYPNFYLCGALMTGELLEITAVPELRDLAHKISLKILK